MKSLDKSTKPVELAKPSIAERWTAIDPSSVEAKIAQELCDSLNATVLEHEKDRNKTMLPPNK
jgi:hypothetical protein